MTIRDPGARMTTYRIVFAAVIAALYAALTILLAPISYGEIQCRVSEALCVLPFFCFEAVPGLTIGCFLANLMTGEPMDMLFGTLATFLAAVATYLIGKRKLPAWLAPLPPVLSNAFIVGWLLVHVYQVGMPFWLATASVAAGEAVACYVIGMPLIALLKRHPEIFPKRIRDAGKAPTKG